MFAAFKLNQEKPIYGYWCNAWKNEITEWRVKEVDNRTKRRKFFFSSVKLKSEGKNS